LDRTKPVDSHTVEEKLYSDGSTESNLSPDQVSNTDERDASTVAFETLPEEENRITCPQTDAEWMTLRSFLDFKKNIILGSRGLQHPVEEPNPVRASFETRSTYYFVPENDSRTLNQFLRAVVVEDVVRVSETETEDAAVVVRSQVHDMFSFPSCFVDNPHYPIMPLPTSLEGTIMNHLNNVPMDHVERTANGSFDLIDTAPKAHLRGRE